VPAVRGTISVLKRKEVWGDVCPEGMTVSVLDRGFGVGVQSKDGWHPELGRLNKMNFASGIREWNASILNWEYLAILFLKLVC
jgi:hypothetical protein